MMKKYLFLALVLLSFQSFSMKQPPQWTLLPDESHITFTATQNNAPVFGEFKLFSAEILVDPKDISTASVKIEVDIHSLSVTYGELKETLMGKDWFNVTSFPKAVFKATQFKQLANNHFEAMGTLTIREKSVPVSLTFMAEEINPSTRLVSGHVLIKRNSFGVGQGEWSSTNEIKDEVDVLFKLKALRK